MESRTVTQAADLAAQFAAVNDALIDAATSSSDDQWQRVTASEGWSVGVVAHHVSEVQRYFIGVLTTLIAGDAPRPSLTSQDVDENNASHARQYAGVGQAETLDALTTNGATLVRLIEALDDAQLARPAFNIDGQELTAAQVVQFGLIGHFQEHLASIRATLEA